MDRQYYIDRIECVLGRALSFKDWHDEDLKTLYHYINHAERYLNVLESTLTKEAFQILHKHIL